MVLGCTVELSAQELTKKEKCDIKKELRDYRKDPESYVAMKKEQAEKVENLEQKVAELEAKLAEAQQEKEALLQKISDMEEKYQALLDSMPTALPPEGTVYQVQMGYYQQLDLVSFNNKLKVIKAEESQGAKRYVIGYFESPMAAMQFANDMKALGIDDAFVTQYVDGVRNMDYDVRDEVSN